MTQEIVLMACIVVSAAFLVLGLLLKLPVQVKTFMFSACVLLLIYDIVFDSVMKLLNELYFDENLLIVVAAIGMILLGNAAQAAAAVLVFKTGTVINQRIALSASNAAESIFDIRPEIVNAVVNGAIVRTAAGKIQVGDVVSVSPGDYIPFDGIVTAGTSSIDISALTGERMTRRAAVDDIVLSGGLNLDAALNIRVTADFDESTVSRVTGLVNAAANRRSHQEKTFGSIARLFMPAAAAVAVIVGLAVPFVAGLPYSVWLARAFGVLFVSSLSATALSIPLTYFNAGAGAINKGLLFKGADVFDTLARTTSVVFGKTGILTNARYQVTDITAHGLSHERLLILASYAEYHSAHPMARAIVREAQILPDEMKIDDFREFPGKGTQVDIGKLTVSAGNLLFMTELGITPDISQSDASVVYIAVNGNYAGRILLSDDLRTDAKKAVRDLAAIGIDRIALFTGDKKQAAEDICTQLNIREFYAECQPEEKVSRLKGLHDMQLSGDKLVFVGDGTQDVPALMMADAGIILGGLGAKNAADAADLVVMTDKPSKVAEAIVLARQTSDIVRQNILITVGFKAVILILLLTGLIPVWAAVLIDVATTTAAVVNALRAFGSERFEKLRRLLQSKPGDEPHTREN